MRRCQTIFPMFPSILLLFAGTVPAGAVSVSLAGWGLNMDGSICTDWDSLPDYADASGSDRITGMGTLRIVLDTGIAGGHSVSVFFDHEIDNTDNSVSNEYGGTYGEPDEGQSWEIDEPGYVFGDIYDNFLSGTFDNSVGTDAFSPDDVSLGMSLDFMLKENQQAMITFVLGEEMPGGFCLFHTDPDSGHTFCLSAEVSATPEPGTLALMCAGVAGFFIAGRKRKKQR